MRCRFDLSITKKLIKMATATTQIEILVDGKIAIYYSSDFSFVDLRVPATIYKKEILDAIERNEIVGFYHTSYGDIYAKKVDGSILCEEEMWNKK
jgi:hypothetical protein